MTKCLSTYIKYELFSETSDLNQWTKYSTLAVFIAVVSSQILYCMLSALNVTLGRVQLTGASYCCNGIKILVWSKDKIERIIDSWIWRSVLSEDDQNCQLHWHNIGHDVQQQQWYAVYSQAFKVRHSLPLLSLKGSIYWWYRSNIRLKFRYFRRETVVSTELKTKVPLKFIWDKK